MSQAKQSSAGGRTVDPSRLTYAGPFSTSFSILHVTVVPLTLAVAPVMVYDVAEL